MPEIDPKNMEAYAKSVKVTSKELKLATKLVKEFGKESSIVSKTTDKALQKNIKYLSDFSDEIDDGTGKIRKMSRQVAKLHLKDALGTDEASKLNSELGKLQKKLVDQHKSLKAGAGANEWKAQRAEVKKLEKQIDEVGNSIEEAEQAAISFGDAMEKSGPSFLKKMLGKQKGVSKEIGGWSNMFNKTGTSMGKMPGLLGATGKAAKGLGKTLGGVSKMFGGWPGLILMAVKKIWDVGMEADQFVKDSNKAFARLRGPDITGDVKKQFKEFNDQIFKTSDNLRTGMDVTQIRSLMESMVQAGYNITQLNKGLMGYRDAIYISAKASKTLGMELPMVGAAVGKMFTDLRMNLDDIDKAFVQVGFDAKKSGLSTDRFWTAVTNATAHLALYGVVMSSASKTMKRFTEDMVGGADDAEEAVTDMYDVFKKGSLENQAALLDMVKHTKGGAKEIRDAFKDLAGEKGARALVLKGKISLLESQDKSPEVLEELKKSRSELYSVQSQQQEALESMKGDSVVQAAQMGMLASKTPELLMRAIQGMTDVKDMTEIKGDKMWVAIKSAAAMGVSEKTVRMLVRTSQVTEKRLEDLVGTSDQYLSKIAGDTDIQTGIQKVLKSKGDEQILASDQLAKLFVDKTGMQIDKAQDYVDLLKAGNINSVEIGKLISQGDPKSIEALNQILTSSETIKNLTSTRFKDQQKTEGQMADAAEDTFKGIVGQTLSYKEMMEIAKDEIKWRASSLGVFQALNKGVMNIFGFMTRNNADYMSESQKIAQEQVKKMAQSDADLKTLIAANMEGNISRETQIRLSEALGKKMANLKGEMGTEEKIGSAMVGVKTKDEAVIALNELKEELKEEFKGDDKGFEKATKLIEAQKSSLEKMAQVQESLKNLPSALSKPGRMGDQAAKELEEVKKTIEAASETDISKEEKASLKELISNLEDVNKNLGDPKKADKIRVAQAKIDKLVLEKTIKIQSDSQKRLANAQEQLTKLETMKNSMGELNKTNKIMADYQLAKMRSDPTLMSKMAEDMASEIRTSDLTKEDLMSDYSLDYLKDMEKTLKKDEKDVPIALRDAVKNMSLQEEREKNAITAEGKAESFAGLMSPRIVTSPGIVSLHPDEMIMPSGSSDFKSEPMIAEASTSMSSAAGSVGQVPGNTPIEITINANEKDLAQKVANECRRVINEYQMP